LTNIPSGKGERLVMLTGITEEFGMLEGPSGNVIDSLMLFKAGKARGDYHKNMDSDMFCKWLTEFLFPILERMNLQAILVLDNASYHTVPAEGCIITKSITTKIAMTAVMDEYKVPYIPGRAPAGDTLIQLREKMDAWLKVNAAASGLKVGITRVQEICEANGHFPPLMLPPYHPELQPIEDLWRDVKQYVARNYRGGRTMEVLRTHVLEGFRRYGTRKSCSGYCELAKKNEKLYSDDGKYGTVIDLTDVNDPDDDDEDGEEEIVEGSDCETENEEDDD
jgi:transposase